MKKRMLTIVVSITLAFSLAACGKDATETTQPDIKAEEQSDTEDETAVGMPNPWRDCTEEEVYQYTPNGFSAPEGSTNIRWSMCEVEDNTVLPGTMVQQPVSRQLRGQRLRIYQGFIMIGPLRMTVP